MKIQDFHKAQVVDKGMSITDRLIKFLNEAPLDEVFTREELAEKINVTINGRFCKSTALIPADYRTMVKLPGIASPVHVYGHPHAITTVKENR
jgi:hypothetical protein